MKPGRCFTALINNYNDVTEAGHPMHDVNTIFYLLHPEAYQTKDLWVDIQTSGPAIGGNGGRHPGGLPRW